MSRSLIIGVVLTLCLLTLMQCIVFKSCEFIIPQSDAFDWPVILFMLLNAFWLILQIVQQEFLMAVSSLVSLVLVKPFLAFLFFYPPFGCLVLFGLAAYIVCFQVHMRSLDVLQDA